MAMEVTATEAALAAPMVAAVVVVKAAEVEMALVALEVAADVVAAGGATAAAGAVVAAASAYPTVAWVESSVREREVEQLVEAELEASARVEEAGAVAVSAVKKVQPRKFMDDG